MRVSFIGAIVASIVVFSASLEAQASIKRPTAIAPQQLTQALKTLVQEREFQLIYSSDLLADRRTRGATGELTMDEALLQLLSGTGLTYRYVDENTVSIVPLGTQPPQAEKRDAEDVKTTAMGQVAETEGSQKKSFWDRFRLAQAGESKAEGTEPGASPEPPAASADGEGMKLEEIVVTAQKRKERLQDVPISISVLSGNDLDKSTAKGVAEALNRVPGVVALAGGMGGGDTKIAMRGVGASGPVYNGASPIGYYLDGVPIAQIRQSIVPDSNVFDLERIEVLRGPQGTLYGVNAENGLVRVLTHDADLDAFEFKARSTLSSTHGGSENYRGDMALNVPIVAGKLAARAAVGYQNLSGWLEQPNKHDINDAEVRNYRLKVNAQPTEKLAIGFTGWRASEDRGAPSISNEGGLTQSLADQPISSDFEVGGLKVDYELAAFSLSSMTSYVDYTSGNTLDAGGINPAIAGLVITDDYWSRTFSQEVLFNSNLSGPWKWTAGAFFRDTDDRYVEQSAPAPVGLGFAIDIEDRSTAYAVFGEVSRRFLNNEWEWTLGGRYFHDDLESEPGPAVAALPVEESASHATTPRAVLTWYPTDDFTGYLSYSEGFRSSVPLGYTVTQSVPTFPALKPDKLKNYEIGAKANVLDRRLSLDAAIYYIDWRDVQQTLRVPFQTELEESSIIALANGKGASGFGADLALTLRPLEGLELGINASHNKLEFDGEVLSAPDPVTGDRAVLFGEGERLAFSPETTCGASIDYVFPIGAKGFTASISGSANYTSKQISRAFAATSVIVRESDDLLLSRASIGITAPDDRWSATLFADNLGDEDGAAAPPLVARFPFWSTRLRPRTIGLQVDFRL